MARRQFIFFVYLLAFFVSFWFVFAQPGWAASQGGNQLEQSGSGTRFETGSVDPMWGGTGEYTFQTYLVDPQGREPEFVKIYWQRGGEDTFASHLMTKGGTTERGAIYTFRTTINAQAEGIYQFYFEAKIGGKLIHGPSYGGDNCQPGGCGECCGVWGGPKILSTKLIEENKIYLFEKDKNNPVLTYDVGKNWITAVDISPDEKYLAAADNNQNLYLFDINQKKLKWQYRGDPVTDTGNLGMDKGLVAFADGDYLAASLKGVVFLFQVDREQPLWSHPTGAVLNGLAIAANGEWLAAGGRDTYVYLWQKDSSIPAWQHKIEAKGGMMGGSVIRTLSMTAAGQYFVVGTSCPDRSVHVFTPQSSTPIFKAKVGINFPVESVDISADGQQILAGGGGSPEDPYAAVLYKVKQNKPVWNFDASVNPVNEVAISADGVYCAIGSIMEGIFVNECTAAKPLWRVKNTGYIGSLSFSQNGEYLAAGTGTNHILLLTVPQKKILHDWSTVGKAEAARVSLSGRYVAAGTGLNRYFMISGEGANTSGAGGTEIKEQKPEIVEITTLAGHTEPAAQPNIFTKIKGWIVNIFRSFSGKSQSPSSNESCGNGLCEPNLGETQTNCASDCTPS